MNNAAKQRLTGAICVLCAIFMTFCMSQMIPPGLAGEVGKVKVYFFLMMATLIVSLPSGAAYYYYRSRRSEETSFDRLRIEAEILAQAGRKPTESTHATAAPSHSAVEQQGTPHAPERNPHP